MEHNLIEQMLGSVLIIVISLVFIANPDVLYGAGTGAVIVSYVARLGFAAGVAWFMYELWLFNQRKRFLASMTALAPNQDELDRRLRAGESIDAIAREFHQDHNVPERFTMNLALEEVQRWLSSDDANDREQARHFVANQTIESGEPPDRFLDHIREESVGIYIDDAVLLYRRSPGEAHFMPGLELREDGQDDSGSLLLTTAYLYFLSRKPTPKIDTRPFLVRLGTGLFNLVRFPVSAIVQFLQDFVPWLGETVSVGTKLQVVLGQTFNARQVRAFKRQFGYAGSFAIPLAGIESLAPTQPFAPAFCLEVGYRDEDNRPTKVWFRSDRFAPKEGSRRNWVSGQTDSPELWASDWIRRIRLMALGEANLIDDPPARLPDRLKSLFRPFNIWIRGDHGPHSKAEAARIRRRAGLATGLLVCLLFGMWLAPPVLFFLLILSGIDPFTWLEKLGGWGFGLYFLGIAVWIATLMPVVHLSNWIVRRIFGQVKPLENAHSWFDGPIAILQNPDASYDRLSSGSDGLHDLIDRSERDHRTPSIHTRLAVGEMLLRRLAGATPETATETRRVLAALSRASGSKGFPAQPSTKTNIYHAQNMHLERCDGLEANDQAGALLIGLRAIFVFAGGTQPLLAFDDHDDLSQETLDRLKELWAQGNGLELPFVETVGITALPAETESTDDRSETRITLQLLFDNGDTVTECRLQAPFNDETYRLMATIWCASAMAGQILTWKDTEYGLVPEGDLIQGLAG